MRLASKLQAIVQDNINNYWYIKLKPEVLNNNPNGESEDSKKRITRRSGFWVSAKVLSIVAILLGIFVIISGYLNIPALTQVYPEWISMQFDIWLGILLIVMGAFLALVVGLSFSAWRKSESLQKNLEDEIIRRKKVNRELDRTQEISNIGSWVLEILDQKMQWSHETCKILDYSPKNTDRSFQRFLKSVHPDDRSFVENEILKAIGQGTAINLTHRIVRRDGSIRIVKQRSETYLNRNGKPTQILGTLQDITAQKESENLATRLGRIIDKSFNEIYFFDAETFKFTRANLAARLNLRYSMEELYEMTPLDLLAEFTSEQFGELVASLNKGIESVTTLETVYKRKDKTLYPVDVRLQLSRVEARPQFVAVVQDITNRKKVETLLSRANRDLDRRVHERTSDLTQLTKDLQMEIDEQKKALEELEINEYRLIKIMNNVVDGIITIDEEGIIHSFNRAAENLFGFKLEEVLGQDISVILTGPDITQRDGYFKNLLQSQKSAALGLRRVITARKKDGTTFFAELAVNETVIRDQRMFTGLIRNLTETERIEHELMQNLKPTMEP